MSHYTWKPVALHLCLLLQQQGFTLNGFDNGEEEALTNDIDKLVENLTACDDARLYVSRPYAEGGTKKLALFLVLGNEPHETVADYTVDDKLEAALELFEEFWSRRKTPLSEAEASWVEEVRGLFGEPLRDYYFDTPPTERPTPITDEPVSLREATGRPKGSISRIHQYDADACCRRFDTLERELAEARERGQRLVTEKAHRIAQLEQDVAEASEQRDRMAAFIQHQLDFNNLIESVHDEARQLLFSVEGGSTPSPNWHALYQEARARIEDMLKGDDGQAWEEVRKFITRKGGAQ